MAGSNELNPNDSKVNALFASCFSIEICFLMELSILEPYDVSWLQSFLFQFRLILFFLLFCFFFIYLNDFLCDFFFCGFFKYLLGVALKWNVNHSCIDDSSSLFWDLSLNMFWFLWRVGWALFCRRISLQFWLDQFLVLPNTVSLFRVCYLMSGFWQFDSSVSPKLWGLFGFILGFWLSSVWFIFSHYPRIF